MVQKSFFCYKKISQRRKPSPLSVFLFGVFRLLRVRLLRARGFPLWGSTAGLIWPLGRVIQGWKGQRSNKQSLVKNRLQRWKRIRRRTHHHHPCLKQQRCTWIRTTIRSNKHSRAKICSNTNNSTCERKRWKVEGWEREDVSELTERSDRRTHDSPSVSLRNFTLLKAEWCNYMKMMQKTSGTCKSVTTAARITTEGQERIHGDTLMSFSRSFVKFTSTRASRRLSN